MLNYKIKTEVVETQVTDKTFNENFYRKLLLKISLISEGATIPRTVQ